MWKSMRRNTRKSRSEAHGIEAGMRWFDVPEERRAWMNKREEKTV